MHLGNGAITPECGVLTLGVAAIGTGVAWQALQSDPQRRQKALTAGALGSLIFAAQMFNVQVLPGVSAHLVGGVLLAWIVGPALGVLTMAAILLLQATMLSDGGLLALGANIFNMAILPALVVAAIRRRGPMGAPWQSVLLIVAASWVSIVAAAGLIVGEAALFRAPAKLTGLAVFATQMLATHALLGLLEGVVTCGVLWLLGGKRKPALAITRLDAKTANLVGVGALALAVLCLPQFGLVSGMPDGYEAALGTVDSAGFAIGGIESPEQLIGWSAAIESLQISLRKSTAHVQLLSVVLSTLLAGGLGWGLASMSIDPQEAPAP